MSGADPARIPVLHVGDSPASSAGGISRVIRGHLARDLDGFAVAAVPSFDPQAASALHRQRPALTAITRLVARGFVRPGSAILHVHVSKGASHVREGLIAALGRGLGWRVVVTWHASTGLPAGRAGRLALAAALRVAHVVTVLSPFHADLVPVRHDRVVVMPNDVPVPMDVAPMSEREPWVVFAGEVGVRKGADLLLAAWGSLPEDLRGTWELHLHGRVADEFAQDAAVAGAEPSVHVHGLTPSAEVVDRLGRAAVAVLPSRAEALPMFLLEAMAAGCAVVGTEVGGVPHLLRDGAGVLLPPDDPDRLAEALSELLGSPLVRARAGRAARARTLGEFSSTQLERRWHDLYLGLAAAAKA